MTVATTELSYIEETNLWFTQELFFATYAKQYIKGQLHFWESTSTNTYDFLLQHKAVF